MLNMFNKGNKFAKIFIMLELDIELKKYNTRGLLVFLVEKISIFHLIVTFHIKFTIFQALSQGSIMSLLYLGRQNDSQRIIFYFIFFIKG